MTETVPLDALTASTAPLLAVAPTYKDPRTGALYVHQDLRRAQAPWAEEAHLEPIKASERFGDVPSWVAYVQRFTTVVPGTTYLTWNAAGLRAVLDYHGDADLGLDEPTGRCQWEAVCPFVRSIQWRAWLELANGHARSQREAIERLEDLGSDIVEPAQTDLMTLLRSLRASVNAKADAELRPDGTTNITFSKDQSVKSGVSGSVDLPPQFLIAIPVLKGHTDEQGRPVLYRLAVRLRVAVDNDAHLSFRFTIPTAERVLENVYADRVAAAKALLGEEFSLLRAAD